jgi:hypothetical protein
VRDGIDDLEEVQEQIRQKYSAPQRKASKPRNPRKR